ncbi:hypothetical protein, partial [Pseudomonas oryzihabitans]|uniref:hypothetical protein n=1 Tax=Pseudomonas oryzihabitans TaxID=47885 RepID=UPI001D1FAF60
VENGAAFSTWKPVPGGALTPTLSRRERGLSEWTLEFLCPRRVENGAAFSTWRPVPGGALTPALSRRERGLFEWAFVASAPGQIAIGRRARNFSSESRPWADPTGGMLL